LTAYLLLFGRSVYSQFTVFVLAPSSRGA
jgi:hypothetical protein